MTASPRSIGGKVSLIASYLRENVRLGWDKALRGDRGPHCILVGLTERSRQGLPNASADEARDQPALAPEGAKSVRRLTLVPATAEVEAAAARIVSERLASRCRPESVELLLAAGTLGMAARLSPVIQACRSGGVPLEVILCCDDLLRNGFSGVDAARALEPLAEAAAVLDRERLPYRIVCTLTPENCYLADDLLRWNELNPAVEVLFFPARSFHQAANASDPDFADKRFHVSVFFDQLARVRKHDLAARLFYRRQARRLETRMEADRSGAGLEAVATSREVPAIMGAEEHSAAGLEASVRRAVTESAFACFGARIAPPPTGELLSIMGTNLRGKLPLRRPGFSRPRGIAAQTGGPQRESPSTWRRVLITGWYGTETQGDKAILGELLHFIATRAPGCEIVLTTIYPKVSWQTVGELDHLAGAKVVPIGEGSRPELIDTVDAVIMGGGPLMESAEMLNIGRIFAEATRQRKARIVFGCGIGPIHTEQIREITAAVLRMATAGFVRDRESHEYATRLEPAHRLAYACDPAVGFINRWREEQGKGIDVSGRRKIAGLVRANTGEFAAGTGKDELTQLNETCARKIAEIAEPVCRATDAIFELLHMNAPWVGGDDRLFNRSIEARFQSPELVHCIRSYLPLNAHLRRLASANAAVAMRYHGHIFCMALGVPFISIDYTGQTGKVSGLVGRIGYTQWSHPWGSLDVAGASRNLERLMTERAQWSAHLRAETSRLVGQLEDTYRVVFEGRTANTTANPLLSCP